MKLPINKPFLLSKFMIVFAVFSTGIITVNAQDANVKNDTAISILVKEKAPKILPEIDEKIKKSEVFRIVCMASLKSDNNPLYILDGNFIDNDNFYKIDQNSIEKIEVLKDKAAMELFGSRGKNGAVIITSKKQMMPPKSKISK